MNRCFQSSISAFALGAMVLGGVVATVGISVSPAFSQGNSGNSNDNSSRSNRNENNNRGGRENNNGRGAVASSLGALNAANANANALANASANSRVGMIQIYKLAVGATVEAIDAIDVATLDLATFEENCIGSDSVGPKLSAEECEAFLDAETEGAPEGGFTNDSYVDWLELAVSDANTAKVEAKDLEERALLAAANKSTDDAIIQALWSMLDIDGYELPEATE